MIVLYILLLVLLVILLIPVGVDACWDAEQRWVKLKIGPFRKTLLPGSGKKKTKKKPKPKLKLGLDDLMELAEIGLSALRRFNYHLSVDRLHLRYTAASADPYGAVVQYGRVNALLGALSGPLHAVFHVRDEDVRTELDFEADRPCVAARLVLTIQVWEILYIAVREGIAGLKWYIEKKREARALAGDAGKELV